MKLYAKQNGQLLKWETPETDPALAIDDVHRALRDRHIRVLALITEKPAPTVVVMPGTSGDAA